MQLFSKNDHAHWSSTPWKKEAFDYISDLFHQKTPAFPCLLGIAGFMNDHLRYGFVSSPIASDETAHTVAAYLQSFVPNARSCGKNASLILFFSEKRDLGDEAYNGMFWALLDALHGLDTHPWPQGVPQDPEHPLWEFCFAGEPIFVVCNTPSHRNRMSRYSPYFSITFQPRWVFEDVIGLHNAKGKHLQSQIRNRLQAFDTTPPSPFLGLYGEEENREWKQYYLFDGNDHGAQTCPFHDRSSAPREVRIIPTQSTHMPDVVQALLPPTGSLEIQRDTPFRQHDWHTHASDETLHILEGGMEFETEQAHTTVQPGDRILLPARTVHRSRAGSHGCLYVIATRLCL